MQWNDRAIVLSVRRLGENSAVIHVVTPEHGMYGGVDRGAFGKRKRGIYQPGNIVSAHWNARLAEHLGSLDCELLEPIAAHILDDRRKLAALHSATLLAEKTLAERDQQPQVYEALEALVQVLRCGEEWLAAYVRLEFTLLVCAGFGLDLESCAATGQEHDLCYVSPRTGRAVSREAGLPYHDRLLALPAFLLAGNVSTQVHLREILNGIRLCGHFLEARVFAPRGIPMTPARARFVRMLEPLQALQPQQ
jgi:DNA repair protein RecO (recombination protein O)